MNVLLDFLIYFTGTFLTAYICTNLLDISSIRTMRNTYRKICTQDFFMIYYNNDDRMYKYIFDNGLIIQHYIDEYKIIINDITMEMINHPLLLPFHYYYGHKLLEFSSRAACRFCIIEPLTQEQLNQGYQQAFAYRGERVYQYIRYSELNKCITNNFKFLK